MVIEAGNLRRDHVDIRPPPSALGSFLGVVNNLTLTCHSGGSRDQRVAMSFRPASVVVNRYARLVAREAGLLFETLRAFDDRRRPAALVSDNTHRRSSSMTVGPGCSVLCSRCV